MGPDLLVPFAGFAGLMGGRPPAPNLVHLVIFIFFSSGTPVEFSIFFLPVRLFPLSWKGAPPPKMVFFGEGGGPHILSILVFQAVALYTAGKEAAGRGQGGQGGRGGGSCTKGGGFAATK